MAKRKEVEKSMLGAVAKKIKKDNKTVDELIDKIMKEVEVWVKDHKKDWDELSDEDRSTLTEPTYLVSKVAEIKYAQDNLRRIVYANLKRAPGNLGEEERMLGVYETLAKFGYKCPYSDTLLIGGEQKIHLDHIIPKKMGGPTDDWNCIPVCGTCNESKNDRHLLDWWEDNRTPQEEYKLVKIFEHMASKLLDETNEIHYLETEDKTKHLDAITFLNQLYDHIEENKEYIFECTFQCEKEKTKAIEKKLKELKSTLAKVTKKNNKNTKTDKQHFAEIKEMVKFVKSLGVSDYYKIAYTYFNEIQEMQNNGTSEEEIREFCFDKDSWFPSFYIKLVEYKNKNGSFYGVTMDKDIGQYVGRVRSAYKGRGSTKLTSEMIDKLNEIGFPWTVEKKDMYKDWFTPFYEELVKYKEKYGNFDNVRVDKELGTTVARVRLAYKGMSTTKLTQEMIDLLNEIGFPWIVEKEDWFTQFLEKLIEYKNKEIIKDGKIVKRNNSFDFVIRDKEIGARVNAVRQAKKGKGNLKLTQEMIDELNEIGFPWIVEKKDWFTPFYEKVIKFKEDHGSFYEIGNDEEIGGIVSRVRLAKKGKGTTKITEEMIKKLDEIGFPWVVEMQDRYRDWFTPFYEKLIKYRDREILNNKGKVKKEMGSFIGVTQDKEIGATVKVVRMAKKGIGTYKLTQEMIDKLNSIGFPWEGSVKKKEEGLSV